MKINILGWMKIIIALSLAISSVIAIANDKQNGEQILSLYNTAHAKKDVSGLMALVLFQTGGDAEKNFWRASFEAETRVKVITKIVPISDYSVMLSPAALKRISPTIKLLSWLVVEYPPESESVQRGGLYLIGFENGRTFIVGP